MLVTPSFPLKHHHNTDVKVWMKYRDKRWTGCTNSSCVCSFLSDQLIRISNLRVFFFGGGGVHIQHEGDPGVDLLGGLYVLQTYTTGLGVPRDPQEELGFWETGLLRRQ